MDLIHIKSCYANQFRRLHIKESASFQDFMGMLVKEYGQQLFAKYEHETGQMVLLDSPAAFDNMIMMYKTQQMQTQKKPTLKIYLEAILTKSTEQSILIQPPTQQPTFHQYPAVQPPNPQGIAEPQLMPAISETKRLSKNFKGLKVGVGDSIAPQPPQPQPNILPPINKPAPLPPLKANPQDSPLATHQYVKITDGNKSYMVDFSYNDFQQLDVLGKGASAVVRKVFHVPTNRVMAMKTIAIEFNPEMQKQILTELQVLHSCKSEYIIGFYGAFFNSGRICILTEHMDLGSLEKVYQRAGSIPEPVLGVVTVSVIKGLVYLYDKLRVMHRDIKPSNMLINSKGEVRICDFGVSAQLHNSLASTFVGTNAYMAPERMGGGSEYSIRSDIWSLGLSLVEMACGRFPYPPPELGFPPSTSLSVLDLYQYVVNEPPPILPETHFTPQFSDFCRKCLTKDPLLRPTPQELVNHVFFRLSEANVVDLSPWIRSLLLNSS